MVLLLYYFRVEDVVSTTTKAREIVITSVRPPSLIILGPLLIVCSVSTWKHLAPTKKPAKSKRARRCGREWAEFIGRRWIFILCGFGCSRGLSIVSPSPLKFSPVQSSLVCRSHRHTRSSRCRPFLQRSTFRRWKKKSA
jgi:hypothetical protein